MNALFHQELVSPEYFMFFLNTSDLHKTTDLSGLTLQSGPSRLVKDEYTPGPVVGGGLDLDGPEMGTIKHLPHQPGGYGYPQG